MCANDHPSNADPSVQVLACVQNTLILEACTSSNFHGFLVVKLLFLLIMDPSAGIPGVTHCNAIQAAHGKSCDRAVFFPLTTLDAN